ncbi:MAG TPA: SDR family oxidoreductase [Verrucomicrobiae bacterium]|nr:SDR family oxidoreductase [Verrucomicrobiae bacterium]
MTSPEKKLQNVLITGGSDGLGRGAAEFLAARGYRVFAGSRNAQRLAELKKLAGEKNLPLEVLPLDVTNDASVDAAVAEAERRAGSIDVLINNAGIAIGAVMEEITLADLRKQFETNFFGVVRVTQRVLPGMRRRGQGRIINMSSIAGKVASPLMGPYSSSKHALEAVSDSLRLELYPFGISVVLIEPGFIPTSINRNAAELSSAYAGNAEKSPYHAIYQGFLSAWQKTTNASRYTPEDCARVILRAIQDDPPRARYLVTKDAKIATAMKWLLSDRAFDRGMIKRFGLDVLAKNAAETKSS